MLEYTFLGGHPVFAEFSVNGPYSRKATNISSGLNLYTDFNLYIRPNQYYENQSLPRFSPGLKFVRFCEFGPMTTKSNGNGQSHGVHGRPFGVGVPRVYSREIS